MTPLKIISAFLVLVVLVLSSCENPSQVSSLEHSSWEDRITTQEANNGDLQGKSYLSIYSSIYSQTEHITHDLTSTVSLRNPNLKESIFISNASYYGTDGQLIRTYFDGTIMIGPMETVEIVIDENDQSGGSGANFIFDWFCSADANEPIFEAVMISTSGQQGLSFTTKAVKIK